MSRLKKANHVSPAMHEEVNRHIQDLQGNRSKVQQADYAFLIAKRLIADIPLVPTNERVYDLVQDIMIGCFKDISDVTEAESKENWGKWVARTLEILKSKGILNK